MSDSEEYAGTRGGRVKLFAVMSCVELETRKSAPRAPS
jgi:hypothetical protein